MSDWMSADEQDNEKGLCRREESNVADKAKSMLSKLNVRLDER